MSSRRVAASRGGYRTIELYGNPGTAVGRRKGGLRSMEVQRARMRKGDRASTGFQLRNPFRRPRHSALLAELIGAILGDGCIADYQVQICFHRGREEGYADFLRTTIVRLFGITPGFHYSTTDAAGYVTISNVGIVEFLADMGLRKRPKRIPAWIFKQPTYRRACLRGLIDTDGYIYQHRYRVGGKWY